MINNNERDKAIERISFWLEKGQQHKENKLEGWFTKEDEESFQLAIEALLFLNIYFGSWTEMLNDSYNEGFESCRRRIMDIIEFNMKSYCGEDAVVWIKKEVEELTSAINKSEDVNKNEFQYD